MKNLTKTYQINEISKNIIDNFELKKSMILPENFKNFILDYQGTGVNEILFYDKKNTLWVLNGFLIFEEMEKLYETFLEKYKRKLFPFAFDSGGWHFCLCMDGYDFGTIYINRWTDHLPEEQFLKIADNFEEFINGLNCEEEV